MAKKGLLQTRGTRKKAIAIASIKKGTGKIRINSRMLDTIEPRYVRMRIKEPVIIAEHFQKDITNDIDMDINVKGGGVWGQADASRTAIANGIVEFTKAKGLKEVFLDYDRTMIIPDARRTEPHKPSRSSAGPRRGKQQSKR
ncbi:MAG: 30S ribosomal protein S9 [Candidatus Aenigmarchaeota archaeon]|nr:30S ribosomal protein S9 [Candidatus Aenigmarchaeota archaeon]